MEWKGLVWNQAEIKSNGFPKTQLDPPGFLRVNKRLCQSTLQHMKEFHFHKPPHCPCEASSTLRSMDYSVFWHTVNSSVWVGIIIHNIHWTQILPSMACSGAALSPVFCRTSEWSTCVVGLFTMQTKGFWSSCFLLAYLSASLCVAAIIPLWSSSLPGDQARWRRLLTNIFTDTPSLFACQHLTLWFLLQKRFLVKVTK